MKNFKILKSIPFILTLLILVFSGCQDMEEPPFSDYPLDGPVITVITPSPSGTTTIQSNTETGSITFAFKVEDDIAIANISVMVDGSEISNMSNFDDATTVEVDDLVYDNLTNGEHTFTIKATDSDGNVQTVSIPFLKIQSDPYLGLDGEIFYMPFEESYTDIVSFTEATVIGNPTFTEDAAVGASAYKGAEGSYLTFPTAGLLGEEFSASFWYNLNADPDRAGILVVGPEDVNNGSYPDVQNNRTSGFRFFREAGGDGQIFKLNVGNGTGDNWFDGGADASLAADSGWAHMAFTISADHVAVYINGQVVKEGDFGGISWEGTDLLSIMSGAPRFTEWGHMSDQSSMDDLRLFDKALTAEEVSDIMSMRSMSFNMQFDGNYTDTVSGISASVVGNPGFVDGVEGQAYDGTPGAYLTFPTEGLLSDQFSATMWYNLNAEPDRAGILVVGPEDTANAAYPDVQNKRTSGFRFFREANGTNQIFKLNVGTGDGESWFDGGAAASIPSTSTEWVHLAFTISETRVVVYINGEIVSEGDFNGISWEGSDLLSIMSGGPRFSEWGHGSDSSELDDLTFYNVVLTQEQIQDMLQ
ncbi:Concanavalin A-like lectin/glucanases superfamily protein [Flavobacteriaceae bacterium MAR_2010_188]|nr:Concanavalin A-like lectin/glucanases superfamily protein [Flavobacteriaceae bacterium MAR_2010_188]